MHAGDDDEAKDALDPLDSDGKYEAEDGSTPSKNALDNDDNAAVGDRVEEHKDHIKGAVVDEVKELITEMEAGDYENWQSAAIMQRLQRLPVVQWGDLQAIELFIKKVNGVEKDEQLKEISRLEQAVVDGSVTSFDFQDVLEPVHRADPKSSSGFSLILPLSTETVAEVCLRAKLVADRAKIADRRFPKVDLAAIVRREIEQGSTAGGF